MITLNDSLFSAAELEKIAADAAEMQREVDEYVEWLRSPDGRAWVAQVLQEARTIAEKFKQDCAAGKYALSPSELEQLRRDGVLVKCHPIKSGGVTSD